MSAVHPMIGFKQIEFFDHTGSRNSVPRTSRGAGVCYGNFGRLRSTSLRGALRCVRHDVLVMEEGVRTARPVNQDSHPLFQNGGAGSS
jgi:hypothetical protein